MPGIVGILTKQPRAAIEPQLERMVASMRHESFYRTGTWINESMGVYVGWTAHENAFDDGMPLKNESGGVVLIFSGEEFPEPGTAQRLKKRGHEINGQTSGYLVHQFEEDPVFPASLNGRFHGVVASLMRGTATLFNDRYGMHQIYYYEAKNAFYFAGEAKAILAVCPSLRTPDIRALGEFVACGCALEDRTVFRGIRLLPPGAAWTLRDGAVESRGRYFDAKDWQEHGTLDAEAYYRELRDSFERNLPRYFASNPKIAMSLTGGLDTRMIMAWYKPAPRSLPCYTFGGAYRNSRDVIVARQVARECQQLHEVISVGDEFLSRFDEYAERTVYISDACADISRTAALYVNQVARTIAPVRMAGIYGSEVIRWLPGFKPVEPAPDLFRPELMEEIHTAARTYAQVRQCHPVEFVLFQQAPQRAVNTLEESQVAVRSPYLDNDFVRTVFRAPQAVFANSDVFSKKDVSLRLIADGNPALRRIRTDRGMAGPSGIVSGMCRFLLEFSFKAEYAYDYGMPQAVAAVDHALAPLRLEKLFLGRHKFYHFRIWYRDALAKYVRQMLLDSRSLSRPYLQRKTVERMVREHLNGTRNYTTEIHKLLTLELAHRLFFDI